MILSHESVRDHLLSARISPGTQDNAHRTHGYLSAQFAHLSILYLLARDDPFLETSILPPPPNKILTTSKLLETTGVSLTHYLDVPHALTLLPGSWTGFYSYQYVGKVLKTGYVFEWLIQDADPPG